MQTVVRCVRPVKYLIQSDIEVRVFPVLLQLQDVLLLNERVYVMHLLLGKHRMYRVQQLLALIQMRPFGGIFLV